MSDTASLIVNGLILFAVLEADLGPHRKIGLFRILRPLALACAIIPIFIKEPATAGTGLSLEIAGVVSGVLLGLLAVRLMTVYLSPRTSGPVSSASWPYALLWIAVIGAREAFTYGSTHWFGLQFGSWLEREQVSVAAITDCLIAMAIAMVLTRTIVTASRAAGVRAKRGQPSPAMSMGPS